MTTPPPRHEEMAGHDVAPPDPPDTPRGRSHPAAGRLPLLLVAAAAGLVVALGWAGRPPATSPAPAAPAQPSETMPPTEPLPTPIPVTGTPDAGGCGTIVPSPRLQWTLHIAPRITDDGTGMWVPFGQTGGPYLKAYIKALYGDVWYGAVLDPYDGVIRPDTSPPWPRPDLIRSAAAGVQTTRVGNPMCGRSADAVVPPCYAELVVPLAFLDRLAPDGPFLRSAYFWTPSNQVSESGGTVSRVTALEYSSTACTVGRAGARLGTSRPAYVMFSGCSAEAKRIDTCYLVGCGDQGQDCR